MLRNIVIVNDFASNDGGGAAVARNTALELSKNFNVYFFCSVPPISEELNESKVKVICLGKPDILHDPNRIRAITKGIWDANIKNRFEKLLSTLPPSETIIHVHTWTKAITSVVFSATAKFDFNVIVTFHDYFLFCPNGGFYNYKKNKICELRPLSLRCILSDCDARSYPQKIWRVIRQEVQNRALWKNKNLYFISISNLTRKICESLVNHRGQIFDLPDPVDLSDQKPVDITSNDEYIYVGRLSPEKGVQLFCKALTDIGLKGIVVGDGYLRKDLEKEFPNIAFTGWASGTKKESYMKRAKVLIMPSFLEETFGLVVAEAKSYGIPCIVPDRSAASEQIEDGQSGFIFKSGNIASLKKAIEKYEHADIRKMQEYLIKTFDRDSLSMNTHIEKLTRIYQSILS